jgi:hypothetical protein
MVGGMAATGHHETQRASHHAERDDHHEARHNEQA